MFVVSAIFSSLIAWFGVFVIAARFLGIGRPPGMLMALYGVGLVINLAVAVATSCYKYSMRWTPVEIERVELVTGVYVTSLLVFGGTITGFDIHLYDHIMVFFMCAIISSYILAETKQMLFSFIVGLIALITTALVLDFPGTFENGKMINIVLFTPIVFILFRMSYISYERLFLREKSLRQQMKYSEQLATQLKAANSRLLTLASSDELTGISNRRGMYAYAKSYSISAGGTPIVAVMIDIDYFKAYNDFYGHASGDQVIINVVEVLKAVVDDYQGCIARWGGEEFLYICFEKTEQDAYDIGREIHRRISDLDMEHRGSPITSHVTVSVGASFCIVYKHDDILSCIEKADQALYSVKNKGRNDFHVVRVAKDRDDEDILNAPGDLFMGLENM